MPKKGWRHSKESKRKISEGLKGRPCSAETREKISSANTGKKHSKKARQRMSKANKGRAAWNKGLTKEDHSSIMQYAKKQIGRKYSPEARKKMSEAAKNTYRMGRVPWNKGKIGCYSKETCLKMSRSGVKRTLRQGSSSGRGGYRADLGCYFRSSMESNVARWLDWLIANGKIYNWVYEPQTFVFPESYGPKYYVPDFRITYADGSHYWIETKGRMDHRSKLKIKRLRKHYPNEELVVMNWDEYKELGKKFGKMLPNWEW